MNGISVVFSGLYIFDSMFAQMQHISFFVLTLIYMSAIFEIEIMERVIKRVRNWEYYL
jgi:hypothetical protein